MPLKFNNPIYGGQDPFVCKGDDGRYYSVAETSDSMGIAVYVSDRLTDRGVEHIVYTANKDGEDAADLWAPELWHIQGKWYIYYAGARERGIANWHTHRMFVLEADEPLGPYRFAGKLELGEAMCIDGTVMELPDGKLIFFYMRKEEQESCNCLYMASMDSPVHIAGTPVLLTKPQYEWEGWITEGPFPIVRDGKVGLMYSANAAHLPEYCIAYMKCNNPEEVLNASSWEKVNVPIMKATGDLMGPGHACIVKSPDDSEDWLVFHSKFDCNKELPGGWNRVVNLARVKWGWDGVPQFELNSSYDEPVDVPSGEKGLETGRDIVLLPHKQYDRFCEYRYFRDFTINRRDDCLEIDSTTEPAYGDKVLLRDSQYSDFVSQLTLKCSTDTGAAGFLFRVSNPAAGAERWNGYGVTVSAKGKVQLIKCDRKIEILAQAQTKIAEKSSLTVKAEKQYLSVACGDELLLSVKDQTYTEGSVGFAAFNSRCNFYNLSVSVITKNSKEDQIHA